MADLHRDRWFGALGKTAERGKGKTGPPVHDDLVRRRLAATTPNQLVSDMRSPGLGRSGPDSPYVWWGPGIMSQPSDGLGNSFLVAHRKAE